MTDSLVGKLVKKGKRSLERKLYGDIGRVPDRTLTLSKKDFERSVSSGAGRADLRRQVGVLGKVDWTDTPGAPDHSDNRLLSTGAGRWEYAQRLKQRKSK